MATHKIKIGNREIKLSEPQKKLLDEMDDEKYVKIIVSGIIRHKNKHPNFAYVGFNKERTINSLIGKGVLIQQKTEYGYFKIIKSY